MRYLQVPAVYTHFVTTVFKEHDKPKCIRIRRCCIITIILSKRNHTREPWRVRRTGGYAGGME